MIRAVVVFAVLFSALMLAGCSTRERAPDVKVTGFQPDGSYVLTDSERALSCARLAGTATLHLNDMKGHANAERNTRKGVPRTIVSLFRRAAPVIERRETENMRRYKRDLAIVVAMNKALADKGCATIDVKSHIEDDARLMGVSRRKLK
ncbi:MAG: hypothetical protein ACR2PO_07565 [Methyloligellaceae bacterium]